MEIVDELLAERRHWLDWLHDFGGAPPNVDALTLLPKLVDSTVYAISGPAANDFSLVVRVEPVGDLIHKASGGSHEFVVPHRRTLVTRAVNPGYSAVLIDSVSPTRVDAYEFMKGVTHDRFVVAPAKLVMTIDNPAAPSITHRCEFLSAAVQRKLGAAAGTLTAEQAESVQAFHDLLLRDVMVAFHLLRVESMTRMATVADPAKAHKRLNQGKPAGFEWKEVVITPKVIEVQPYQGGTHASPRQHERRGHWRHLRTGKRVWVKNCLVGDPARGIIKHDYRVEVTP